METDPRVENKSMRLVVTQPSQPGRTVKEGQGELQI
jgi:hypothetical protein